MLELGRPRMSGQPWSGGGPGLENASLGPRLEPYGAELNLPYAACELLVAVAAILGNGLVILVFARERKLRRRTNYYIISLAAADLLVGLFAIPFAVLASIGLPTNLHACLFTVSVLVVLCTISIFCLVAVSIDRYWAILHPMGYSRTVRTKTAIGIICACWVAGTLVGFLPLLGWNAGHKSDEKCIFTEVMDYDYLVFLYFATIIFPALLIAAFYAHIYRVVVKQLQQIVTMNLGKQRKDSHARVVAASGGGGTMLRLLGAAQKREVKAAQNLSRIVAFFIVCWFPLYTINCIMAFCPECKFSEFLLNFCIILSHVNSAGNPLLYAYHLKDFRAALKSFIHGLLFPGRAEGKHALHTQTGFVSVIQEPRGSLMGSQRGFGSTRERVAGSQQHLLAEAAASKYPSLLRQVHESRMREMQAASESNLRLSKDKLTSSEQRSCLASPADKSRSEAAATSVNSASPAPDIRTEAPLEPKSYEFEDVSMQFADSDDEDEEEEEEEEGQTTTSQLDSMLIIEADVNCARSSGNREPDKRPSTD